MEIRAYCCLLRLAFSKEWRWFDAFLFIFFENIVFIRSCVIVTSKFEKCAHGILCDYVSLPPDQFSAFITVHFSFSHCPMCRNYWRKMRGILCDWQCTTWQNIKFHSFKKSMIWNSSTWDKQTKQYLGGLLFSWHVQFVMFAQMF